MVHFHTKIESKRYSKLVTKNIQSNQDIYWRRSGIFSVLNYISDVRSFHPMIVSPQGQSRKKISKIRIIFASSVEIGERNKVYLGG